MNTILKSGILFISIFTFISISSQEIVNNFSIEDNEIIWQKIYPTTLNFDQLVDQVKDKGFLSDIEIRENKITGKLKPVLVDCESSGLKGTLFSICGDRSFFTGFSLIEFKEGRYRVTVRWIFSTEREVDSTKFNLVPDNLEYIAFRNFSNEFTPQFRNKDSGILDEAFSRRFDLFIKQGYVNW